MKFNVVIGNDWQGIYLDGLLLTQDHTISACALLRNMDGYATAGRIELLVEQVDEAWLEAESVLPAFYADVKTV